MKRLLMRLVACALALTMICGAVPAASAAGLDTYDVYLETEGGVCSDLMVFAHKFGNGYYLLEPLPTPTMEGYVFEGWYTDQVGGKEVTQWYNFTEDTTLYAHWHVDTSKKTTEVTAEPAAETPAEPQKITTQDKVIAWTVAGVTVLTASVIVVLTSTSK